MIAANPLSTQTLDAVGTDWKGNKLLSIYITREDFEWLKAKAILNQTSISAVIRELIRRRREGTND